MGENHLRIYNFQVNHKNGKLHTLYNYLFEHIPLLHTYFHVTLLWSGNMLIVLFIFGLQAHFLKLFLPSYFIYIYLYSYYTL